MRFREDYQRVGALYYGDFRERLNKIGELEFSVFKEWLGVTGELVISNFKFELRGLAGVKVEEVEKPGLLPNFRLMYEVERDMNFYQGLGSFKEIIVMILMLKGEYSEEIASNMAQNFFYHCITKLDMLVPNIEWKDLVLTGSNIDVEIERFIEIMSCFHLNDDFIQLENSRIGMYQNFVLASTSDDNLLLSLKNEIDILWFSCEYKKDRTSYFMEITYYKEVHMMFVELKYQGLLGKTRGGTRRKASSIVNREEPKKKIL